MIQVSSLTTLLVVVVLVSLAFTHAASHIDDLNLQSFDSYIEKGINGTLVEFYSPWCGACIHFGPTYDKVARQIQSTSKIKVARVDITKNSALGKRFHVMGVPALIFFIEGESHAYSFSNGSEPKHIVKYVMGGYKEKNTSMDPVRKRSSNLRKNMLKNIPDKQSILLRVRERLGKFRKQVASGE